MGSSQSDVEVSYDVGNEFFRLWLDERMNYTCAVFESPDQSLEAAQLNKLHILSEFANAGPNMAVLDIGCGWGACLEYLSNVRQVERAVGVTLSRAMADEVNQRGIRGVECVTADFMKWDTTEKFDGLISICMIDHLCSPEEARQGKAVDIYRDYFKKCWEVTKPGSSFGFQAILRNRTPKMRPWGGLPADTRQDLEDFSFSSREIFPNGLNPRLEELVAAVNPHWEIAALHTRREDYQRTTAEWLRRLRLHEGVIRERWGDKVFADYDRYLSTCVRAFDIHYSSLVQMKLRRIG